MTRLIYITCAGALCLCAVAQAAPPEALLPEKHQAFFKAHCLDCHDSETQEGKVDLETLSFRITTIEQAELWQKVLNALNAGEMPPEDSEQPGNAEKADFLDDLANTMVTARQALSDSGGKITMRRLNRREYRNTIEQLTGVKVEVGPLPSDGGSGTFDTVGASQFISSDQFEQYLKLGRQAIDEAFERQAAQKQPSQVFRVEPENTVNVQSRKNMQTMEETYQRYLLWKAEVDKAAVLPENEDVLAQLRKKYKLDDLTDSIRLYQNANLLKGGPDAKKFGFRDANAASFSYQGGYGRTYAYMKHYLELPHSDRGTYLKLAWAIQRIDVTPKPENVPPGTYKLRIRAGAVKGSDPSRHFIEIGHPQRVNQVPAGFSSKPLASLQVTGTEDNPEIIETTLVIGSKTPREFGIQERRPEGNQKALSREFYAYKRENGYGHPPAIWIDWVEFEGPLPKGEIAKSKVHRVEPETTINPTNEEYIKGKEKWFERFRQWKKGVDAVAKTPKNQAIIAEIAKKEKGILDPLRFYSFADRLEGTPDAKEFGFNDAPNANSANPDRPSVYKYFKHYASLPHRDTGAYLKPTKGTGRVIVSPEKLSIGNYTLRVRVGAVEGSDPSRHFIDVGHPQRTYTAVEFDYGLEGRAISTHQVSGTIEEPQIIEIPLDVRSDTTREFAVQEKQPNNGNMKALWKTFNAAKKKNGYGMPPAIWIDWVELEGPHSASKANTRSPLQAILAKHAGNPTRERGTASDTDKSPSLASASGYQEISTMKQMTNTFGTILCSSLVGLFCLNAQTLSAENKSKGAESALVIGIIEEAHDDHIVVITRDKYKRTLTFDEKSTVTYVGFDKEKNEIKARFAVRVEVNKEIIQSILVTPPVTEDKVEPTPEMVKMTPAELLKTADLDKSGAVSYVEMSKTLFSSLKHGPVAFHKSDQDHSGSISLKELPSLLAKVKWWKMSRKTPEEWFGYSDQDKNGVLSQEELAVLLGSEAHIRVFFKRADKNTSGDLDPTEVSLFINELIFPSRRNKGRK